MAKGISLASLDARKASSEAVEFEYVTAEGEQTGIFVSILGSQSDKVTSETNRLVNERRQKEAAQAAARMGGREQPTFTPVEDDIAFGQRLAAVRVAGWRKPDEVDGLTADQKERFQGIIEDFTPENALLLCRSNGDFSGFVTAKSNLSGPFMKRSPKA
jgi:hypothetical protein